MGMRNSTNQDCSNEYFCKVIFVKQNKAGDALTTNKWFKRNCKCKSNYYYYFKRAQANQSTPIISSTLKVVTSWGVLSHGVENLFLNISTVVNCKLLGHGAWSTKRRI